MSDEIYVDVCTRCGGPVYADGHCHCDEVDEHIANPAGFVRFEVLATQDQLREVEQRRLRDYLVPRPPTPEELEDIFRPADG